MSTHPPASRAALGTITLVLLLCCAPILHAQDTSRVYENLQVLPSDISEDALNRIMLGNLRGLGLPRLEGRGCLFCHVGDMDRPRDEWDYASDEKLTKRKARFGRLPERGRAGRMRSQDRNGLRTGAVSGPERSLRSGAPWSSRSGTR